MLFNLILIDIGYLRSYSISSLFPLNQHLNFIICEINLLDFFW